jgi:hypothetical protein
MSPMAVCLVKIFISKLTVPSNLYVRIYSGTGKPWTGGPRFSGKRRLNVVCFFLYFCSYVPIP